MKIALLSFEYPPETGFGGIGTYTWHHARALVELGHEVHVLAGSKHPQELTTTTHDGVFVHRYRADNFWMRLFSLFGRAGCHWTRQRLENAYCMSRALKTLRKQHAFDILEMPECGAEGALIAGRVGIPSVVRFHSPSHLIMPLYDVPRADHVLCSAIEQVAIRRAAALTSCSSFLANEVREKMGVNRQIATIPNGIDLALFGQQPPTDITRLYGLPPGKVNILFAGRMERRKGIYLCGDIVEAVMARRDANFIFAGEDLFGYVRNTLLPRLQAKPWLGSFHYLGKLGLQEMRACAGAVDILLLPSLWENCSYSCLEAMAAGRAIVASNQGGTPELIQHGVNGLLAEPSSAQDFAAILERLIDSQVLRQALGVAARRSVEERYTHLKVARSTEHVYQLCVDAPRT